MDEDPTWRATAVFTRDELEMLISDSRVPPNRQVLYALQGIVALRHGEAAGLRWKHFDPNTPVLGRLVIDTSYYKGHIKTKRISLARTNGAREDILELCTPHAAQERQHHRPLYHVPVEALYAEVAKLQVQRH